MRRVRGLQIKRKPLRRAALITTGIAVLTLIAYSQIIHPNNQAAAYEERLQQASDKLLNDFKTLESVGRQLYESPDVSLATKQSALQEASGQLEQCRDQLQHFHDTAQSLSEQRFSGYTNQFQQARADQRHSLNIAGQSRDVLDQYGQLISFLSQYHTTLEDFEAYTTGLNGLADSGSLVDQSTLLVDQSIILAGDAAVIRSLKAPAGFEALIEPTGFMIERAASGIDYLALGVAGNNDIYIDYGFELVELATADYDSIVRNLLFEQLQASYVYQQVGALPAKFKH